MQFYNLYRVKHVEIDLEICNNEAFPILWGMFFNRDSYVGSIPNRDAAINTLENGMTTGAKILAAKGGIDKDHITVSCDIAAILGNPDQYDAEQGYTGTISTSPSLPLYLNLIVCSPNATNLSNGCTTYLKLKFRSEFFAKTNLQA